MHVIIAGIRNIFSPEFWRKVLGVYDFPKPPSPQEEQTRAEDAWGNELREKLLTSNLPGLNVTLSRNKYKAGLSIGVFLGPQKIVRTINIECGRNRKIEYDFLFKGNRIVIVKNLSDKHVGEVVRSTLALARGMLASASKASA